MTVDTGLGGLGSTVWLRSPIVIDGYGLLVHSKHGALEKRIQRNDHPNSKWSHDYFHDMCYGLPKSQRPKPRPYKNRCFWHISILSPRYTNRRCRYTNQRNANLRMQGFGSEPSEDISSRRQRLGSSQRQELEGVVNNHYLQYLDVSTNNGAPKSSILIGFSLINHPFWGPTPIFGNTHFGKFW